MKVIYSNIPFYIMLIAFIAALILNISNILLKNKFMLIKKLIFIISEVLIFTLLLLLIKPILMDNKILTYWYGNVVPTKDWAIGIGLEIDHINYLFSITISFLILIYSIYYAIYQKKHSYILILTGGFIGLMFSADLFNTFVMLAIISIGLTGLLIDAKENKEEILNFLFTNFICLTLFLIGILFLYARSRSINLAQLSALLHESHDDISLFALVLIFVSLGSMYFLWRRITNLSKVSSLFQRLFSFVLIYVLLRTIFTLYQGYYLNKIGYVVIVVGIIDLIPRLFMLYKENRINYYVITHLDIQRALIFIAFGFSIMSTGKASLLGYLALLYAIISMILIEGVILVSCFIINKDLEKLTFQKSSKVLPLIILILGLLSLVGIPPFSGFISKWLMIEIGLTSKGALSFLVVFGITIIITTISSFRILKDIIITKSKFHFNKLKDLVVCIPALILLIICFLGGVFQEFLTKNCFLPTIYEFFDVNNYIDTLMGKGYSAKMLKEAISIDSLSYEFKGYYLFIILFLALAIIILAFIQIYRYKSSKNLFLQLTKTKRQFEKQSIEPLIKLSGFMQKIKSKIPDRIILDYSQMATLSITLLAVIILYFYI